MLDTTAETLIPLADACNLIPPARHGKKTHLSTLLRWILRGTRNLAGDMVRLEAVRMGSRWMTTREALQRFAEALTPCVDSPHAATPRTATQRQSASERAARELDRIGI